MCKLQNSRTFYIIVQPIIAIITVTKAKKKKKMPVIYFAIMQNVLINLQGLYNISHNSDGLLLLLLSSTSNAKKWRCGKFKALLSFS